MDVEKCFFKNVTQLYLRICIVCTKCYLVISILSVVTISRGEFDLIGGWLGKDHLTSDCLLHRCAVMAPNIKSH